MWESIILLLLNTDHCRDNVPLSKLLHMYRRSSSPMVDQPISLTIDVQIDSLERKVYTVFMVQH